MSKIKKDKKIKPWFVVFILSLVILLLLLIYFIIFKIDDSKELPQGDVVAEEF